MKYPTYILQLTDIEDFILNRIKQYKHQKWQDRMLFPSNYLARKIDEEFHRGQH